MKRNSVPFKRVSRRVPRRLVLPVVLKTQNPSPKEKAKAKERKEEARIPMEKGMVASRATRTAPKDLATRTKATRVFASSGPKVFVGVERVAPISMKVQQSQGHLHPEAEASPPAPKVLTATKAAVALVASDHVLGTSASVAGSCYDGHFFDMEWALDSGAGEDLSSIFAFCNQGVPAEWVESYSTVSSSPLTFETWWGQRTH